VRRSGALAGLLNFFEVRPVGIIIVLLTQEELRVAEDRRQKIVEVVRDAAREPAEPLFDLLRLHQPLFEQRRSVMSRAMTDADRPAPTPVTALDEPRIAAFRADVMLPLGLAKRHHLAPRAARSSPPLTTASSSRSESASALSPKSADAARFASTIRRPAVENQHRVRGVDEDRRKRRSRAPSSVTLSALAEMSTTKPRTSASAPSASNDATTVEITSMELPVATGRAGRV